MKVILFILSLWISMGAWSQNATAKDTNTYIVKGQLIEALPLTPDCGIIAWALALKFEILQSEIPGLKSDALVIIQPCPEFLGKDFFKKNKTYLVSVGRNNNASFGYTIVNKYEKEKLPAFWSRTIKLVD